MSSKDLQVGAALENAHVVLWWVMFCVKVLGVEDIKIQPDQVGEPRDTPEQ